MILTRDRISAVLFLGLFVAFYVLARNIELYPGTEAESINARTFPKFIGAMGALISFLMIVLPAKDGDEKIDWAGFDWVRPPLLCLLMAAYGLTIRWPGFFLATTFFLAAGYFILGERRWWMLLVASVPVVASFEGMLTKLLGIYIEDPFLAWIGIWGS